MKGDKVKDRCCKSKMRGISSFFGCIVMSSIGIVIVRLKLISNSTEFNFRNGIRSLLE